MYVTLTFNVSIELEGTVTLTLPLISSSCSITVPFSNVTLILPTTGAPVLLVTLTSITT